MIIFILKTKELQFFQFVIIIQINFYHLLITTDHNTRINILQNKSYRFETSQIILLCLYGNMKILEIKVLSVEVEEGGLILLVGTNNNKGCTKHTYEDKTGNLYQNIHI